MGRKGRGKGHSKASSSSKGKTQASVSKTHTPKSATRSRGSKRESVKSGGISLWLCLILVAVALLVAAAAIDYRYGWPWLRRLRSSRGPDAETVRGYRARLTQLYKKHNTSKLEEIDDILQKWRGREKQLFKALHQKYRGDAKQKRKAKKKQREKRREGETEKERVARVRKEKAEERAERKKQRQQERDGKDFYDEWGDDNLSPAQRKKQQKYFADANAAGGGREDPAQFEGEIDLFDDEQSGSFGKEEDENELADICEEEVFGRLTEYPLDVVWSAPFLSGGGYCTEAHAFAQYLYDTVSAEPNSNASVRIEQHGDSVNNDFLQSLDQNTSDTLRSLLQGVGGSGMHGQNPNENERRLISICHSEPGAWHPAKYSTPQCPVRGSHYRVGRCMFESDRVPDGWSSRLNAMDEIWVPTDFHYDIFKEAIDLSRTRLRVIPEAVNTHVFTNTLPLDADSGWRKQQIFGRKTTSFWPRLLQKASVTPNLFIFLSVFKFEPRKNWRLLIGAFLREFENDSDVLLIVKTNTYHNSVREIQGLVSAQFGDAVEFDAEWRNGRVFVVSSFVSSEALVGLYEGSDALLMASTGEGWGRPHCEAMAVGSAVLATNWSGPTQFIEHRQNGLLIPVTGLSANQRGAFKGHRFAVIEESALRTAMGFAFENRALLQELGTNAQRTMRQKYCVECVGKLLEQRLLQIATNTLNLTRVL